MSQLKNLKDRIHTIQKIGKITSTMRMVSASRLRKVVGKKEKVERYWDGTGDLLAASLKDWDVNLLPEIVRGREKKKRLILVAGSSKGLCGALNSWVLRALRERVESLEQKGEKPVLFPIGKKSISFCKSSFRSLVEEQEQETSMSVIEQIHNRVNMLFNSGKIDAVEAIYPLFVSVMSQKVHLMPLLPIYDREEFLNLHLGTTCTSKNPDAAEVLDAALSAYTKASIMQVLSQTITSETAARMVSMDNASRKCVELSDSLTLDYNRGRQDAITNELLEVISGMEALDG